MIPRSNFSLLEGLFPVTLSLVTIIISWSQLLTTIACAPLADNTGRTVAEGKPFFLHLSFKFLGTLFPNIAIIRVAIGILLVGRLSFMEPAFDFGMVQVTRTFYAAMRQVTEFSRGSFLTPHLVEFFHAEHSQAEAKQCIQRSRNPEAKL